MAGLIDKLLGRSRPVPPEVAEALAELDRLKTERPALAGLTAVLAEALPGLFAEPVSEAIPEFNGEQLVRKLSEGVPLLRGEALSLDSAGLRGRAQVVCTAVAQRQHESVAGLSTALRNSRFNASAAVGDLLAGRADSVAARAEPLGLDPALTATVLRLAAYPVLSRIGAALAPRREGVCWQHGFCPICGSRPLLGEFRGLEQTRFLRCGWCASEWEFPRLRCPHCDNADHRQLGHIHVEGEEAKCRADTCDVCRRYVKMVSTLAPLSPPRLLVADLATTHLDLAAVERGFVASPHF